MAVIAFPTWQGWQHISLVSPIFIYFLLTKISGVNLLENYADEKTNINNANKAFIDIINIQQEWYRRKNKNLSNTT